MYGIRLSNMRERPPAGVAFSLHLEGDEWMVQEKKGRWLALLRKEPVLCIAAVCAAASTLLNPPSPAYLNYIDWRVLTLLFCLMAWWRDCRSAVFLQCWPSGCWRGSGGCAWSALP